MKRSNEIVFQTQSPVSPLSVFCAAASADEALLAQWETFLLPLVEHAHLISCWSERHLGAGANTEQERVRHLEQAHLILLLLSPDFFASQMCLEVMQRALQRQHDKTALVIPLLLRSVDWQATELGNLTPLPANGVPVVQWSSQDEAWHACARGLHPLLRRRLSVSSPAFPSVRAERRAASDRERFLGRLRQTYQELLDRSLYGIAWMELGLANKPDAVRNASHLLLRLPERGEQILPPGTSILDAYEQAQEELLILGTPGAGKSTLLLDLALQLVERANTDETHPLPVILPLSSWAVQQSPLGSWLIEQLARTYDVPRTLSRRWVEQEYILPLLDGLDEMEETARSACIATINTYHSKHLTPLVVCSRQSEYDVAGTRQHLVLQSAVVVQPLTKLQVETYLDQADPSLAAVRTVLRTNPVLQELTTTPLMLSVLTLTYMGAQVQDLPQRGSAEVQQQQVFASYVECMVVRKGNVERYPLQSTEAWLGWLARQMQQHNRTGFYLEHLQPDWLSPQQYSTYTWLAVRLPISVIGALASLGIMSLFLSSLSNNGIATLVLVILYTVLGGLLGWVFSEDSLVQQTNAHNPPIRTHTTGRCIAISAMIGLVVGLSFGFNLAPHYGVGGWLSDGSIYGLSFALCSFMLQIMSPVVARRTLLAGSNEHQRWWRSIRFIRTVHGKRVLLAVVGIGLSFGLSYGLRFGLRYNDLVNGLSYGLREGLIFGSFTGLSFGLTALLISLVVEMQPEGIHLTERLRWTLKSLRSLFKLRHLRNTLLLTCTLTVISSLRYEPLVGLGFGLSLGLTYWLLMGLYQGLSNEQIEDRLRHIPNQGIRRSLYNSVLMGIISGAVIWIIVTMLNIGLSTSLLTMVCGAFLIGAISGGLAALRHFIVRCLFWHTGTFPLNAPHFLNDATARILLRRVGGNYSFMHRLLLDYFANLDATTLEAQHD